MADILVTLLIFWLLALALTKMVGGNTRPVARLPLVAGKSTLRFTGILLKKTSKTGFALAQNAAAKRRYSETIQK